MTPPAEYQSVIVTLSDGRKGTFTGAVLVESKDTMKAWITDIQFTCPKPLPAGAMFGKIEESDDGSETR